MGAEAPEQKKSGKKGLLIGVVLALLLGGGGFYAVWSGMILAPGDDAHDEAEAGHGEADEMESIADVAFVPVEPIIVSLGPGSRSNHLRFRAQLEVPATYEQDVTQLMPRVVDVMNSYLRAVEPSVMDRPGALIDLRAQLLRRVQLVVGEGRVRDLLVMEFVLS
nr:flagellar basal body-associated FliL family protein [Palleronia aestuarii]